MFCAAWRQAREWGRRSRERGDTLITIDEFRRIELRVGEVVAAERITGADRLLKLTVDVGVEKRTFVGGLGAGYRPEQLLGLKVVVTTNLQPATIRGVVSEGMLLGAACADAVPALLTVNHPVPNGTRVQ
jgi:methionyl-tRNA synthetase